MAISPDGTVTVVCHRSEMGQQVRTSMAQIIADELDADWSRVVVAQADGDEKYGSQNTDGSRSVRRNFSRLREAG
ncbi:MAG: molybdopterin cofactor-binding domain-containing protein, partial [Myxococcota bacterium]